MTYQLSALRFRSIGERSARFTDLTLDLTAPGQDGTATPQDSVVWLRNGGGKSSILSLLYAMLLPAANDFMGRSVKRSITDYVDSGDTSHVVAVWEPRDGARTLTGDPEEALITGVVHEWDGLRRPAEAARSRDRLHSHFYACYVVPGVIELGTLPFTDGDGRPRRLSAYLDALRQMARPHAGRTDLVVTNKQYQWDKALRDRLIDPDIYRTQKQMNHVEGGVEDLFKFASAKEFVDFLLDLTTPPEEPAGVAQRLQDVAALLAAKPKKLAERDFCVATAGDLDTVAARYERLEKARADHAAHVREAEALAASFRGAIEQARATASELAQQQGVVRQELTRANNNRSQAGDLAYLYRREAARMRVGEAEEAKTAAEKRAAEAHRQVRAWEVAQQLAALSKVRAELEQAELDAAAEEEEIAPLRAERDRYAALLHRRLVHLAERAAADAEEAETARQAELKTAEEHRSQAASADEQKAAAGSDAAQAEAELSLITQRLRTGAERGHLPAADADPAEHREALTHELADCEDELAALRERYEQRRLRRSQIAQRENELAQARAEAAHDRTKAADRHTELSERLSELTASPRLRELAEATADEPLDLWAEASTLLRRLGDAILAADNERVLRMAEQHADERTIAAQERDGVLPTSLDAERIVHELVTEEIPAESGWAHLRRVLPPDRLIAALDVPAIARLGCGVIVPAASVADAVRLLDSHGIVTTSLVNVYSAQDADDLVRAATAPGDGATPAWGRLEPGLVDADLAEAAVRQLKERAKAHRLRDKELVAQRSADDDLRRSLEDFLQDCPRGHLDVLESEVARLDSLLADIEREQNDLRAESDGLDEADRLDDTARERLEGLRRRLSASIDWLGEVIPIVAERDTWLERRMAAAARVEAAKELQRQHAAAELRARENAENHHANAKLAAREAERYRAEAAALSGPSLAGIDADDDPSTPLDALREQWRRADRAVEQRASQSVLADRVATLTRRVADAEGELGGIDPDLRASAEQLLASPHGQEPALRNAALEKARTAHIEAVDQQGRASSRVDMCKADLREVERRYRQPPRRALPVVPGDSAEADALAADHEARALEASERATNAEAELEKLQRRIDHADGRVTDFETYLELLPPTQAPPAAPFDGDNLAARARAREINRALNEADQRRADEEAELADAVDAVRRTASGFALINGPIKDRVANDPAAVLAPHAADLAGRLRLRAQTLTGELEAIAKDQVILGEALAHLVRESLDTLGRAERASRMPTSHGSWAGRKVLRIAFDRPSDSDLIAYAERVIDQAIAKGLSLEGMPLLKAAVHESVGPRGFTVKVLKPAEDQGAITEDISRLAKWSGGEKLTVCVALYCTLAALRAMGAGRKGRSGGVLLLDNPIGRASSAPLVRLQRDVAAAHGVQLVYTTGVKDPAAVIQFPNVIRLDNREGRSRDRRYIVPDAPPSGSAGPPDAEPGGEVDGVRVAHTDEAWNEPEAEGAS
ncbi:hypothetical protein Acsp04_47300 [Actinomadura sp. NBRC 104425]|uniref:hypothetical protein n=1 Tax=Actinomadura sp. NBRC 104425 TaxID=3032204 RepID=UPI0024A32C14|nr:hypothetical protein [Actinomadura sp. NBRC 104425]GLZ14495.1 hypothetical protein Acsp04_47300 [Actinomadura sp. NBRC 104425]